MPCFVLTLQREVSTEPPCHVELVETSRWRVGDPTDLPQLETTNIVLRLDGCSKYTRVSVE